MRLLPDAAIGFRASNVLAKLDDLCKALTPPQRIALLQQVIAGCTRRMLDAREKLEAEQPRDTHTAPTKERQVMSKVHVLNPVITREQARAITGGRTPLVPAEYEEAIGALNACLSLDEAKYWSDKADALAAWARIYKSDDAGRKARALKLHAYRRMGILAAELRPPNRFDESGRAMPGPLSALMESGLGRSQATAARVVAKLPKRQFERAVASEHPPAPTTFRIRSGNPDLSESWRTLTGRSLNRSTSVNSMSGFAAFCRNHDPKALARGLDAGEVEQARALAEEIAEFIDVFLQRLPRVK